MVLAAGLGARLRPLSLQRAKPAVRFVDRPVVCHVLAWLARQGVGEAVVNLHHLPHTVRAAVDGDPPRGVGVRWSPEDPLLGTGGGLKNAEDAFRGEDAFLLVNGDCLYGLDLGPLLEAHASHRPAATMALMDHPPGGSFAGVDMDGGGRVRRIAGAPGEAEDAWRSMHYPGVAVLTPRVLEALPAGRPCDVHRHGLVPLIAAGTAVRGVRLAGPWHDLGTPARYLHASGEALDRRGSGSWIAPTARVHPEAAVDDRSVLGEDVRVEAGAAVEASVLLDGAVLAAGARARRCVVGYATRTGEGEELDGLVVADVGGRRERIAVEGNAG